MPYVNHNGIRTWYETEGSGPPLVLHIGFLGSLEDWRRDDTPYTAALRDRYQLILLDPRGQGRSDKPHDPRAYTLAARAGDVIAVLDALGIERAHYWGYSMGGSVGFALATHTPNRMHSLIAGGASPHDALDDPTEHVLYRWLSGGIDAFVHQWEDNLGALPPAMRTRLMLEDAEALRASWLAPDWHGRDRPTWIIDSLARSTVPALLYVGGEDDPARVERAATDMPNATFVAFDGLNHAQAFRQRDLVLPHVVNFLDRVDQRAYADTGI